MRRGFATDVRTLTVFIIREIEKHPIRARSADYTYVTLQSLQNAYFRALNSLFKCLRETDPTAVDSLEHMLKSELKDFFKDLTEGKEL